MPSHRQRPTLPYRCALALLLCLVAHPLLATPKRLALGGSPGNHSGLYVIAPPSKLTRVYRDGATWACRPVPLWAGPLAETSLTAGEQRVYGFTRTGQLFNTWLDHGLARFGLLGDRTDLVPGSQTLGGSPENNSGVYAVTRDGKLVRAWWTADGWRFETIPTWGGSIVAGSMIPGERRVLGVTSEGRIFNTYLEGGAVRFGLLGTRTDVVPGSLALGGSPDSNNGVYAVTTAGELIRGWWADNGWHFETIPSWGGKIVAGSLRSGEMRVYGVNAAGQVFNTWPEGRQIRFALLRDDVSVQPDSLALAGSPEKADGVYAVDASGRLLRFWWQGQQWGWKPVEGVTATAGSLVSTDLGVFGLDSGGRVFHVSTEKGSPALSFPCPAPGPGLDRQLELAEVLRSLGVEELSSLGKMTLTGNVVPQPGLTRPRPDLLGDAVGFQAARRAVMGSQGKQELAPLSGTARKLRAEPLQAARQGLGKTDIPLGTAYWAAQWIDLPDGTNVILQESVNHLILLAEKITVGKNVTFTYQRKAEASTTKPPKPVKPGPPTVPAPFSKGTSGAAGSSGGSGERGASYAETPAPQVEVWTLSLTGSPAFDLRGQDGGAGGAGGDGGDGGNGSAGSSSKGNAATCKHGPGDGGDGGPGGRAGDGGAGGNGGPGGRLTLYAPSPVILQLTTAGFLIDTGGGSAGSGGMAGVPGAGGQGGPVGAIDGNACRKPASGRTAGKPGPQGPPGNQGPSGQPGLPLQKPVSMTPIAPDEFAQTWSKPALQGVTTKSPGGRAHEGETVSVTGLRLTSKDVLLVTCEDGQEVPAATQVVSDTLLSFQVPAVPGGDCSIQVEQADGTRSNKASFRHLPRLLATEPGPRIRPGTWIKLKGTGFSKSSRALLANQEGGTVKYVDPHTLELFVVRPQAGIPANPAGEPVSLGVALGDGTRSNEVPVILDTYLIVVAGDSVIWGTGLQDGEKIHARVEQRVRQLTTAGNPGVYRMVEAGTGNKIGLSLSPNDQPGLSAIPGEVPTRYPTITERLEAFRDTQAGAHADLLILDGCANDVGMNTWMDPQRSTDQNRPLIEQACHDDMLELLGKAAKIFPEAKGVITSYYRPLDSQSDGAGLVAFLIAIDSKWFNIPQHVVNGVLKPGTRARVIENCQFFAATANAQLALAVQEANALHAPAAPRFFFADPKFKPENAAMAGPDSWIFGINQDLSPEDNPVVAEARAAQCEAHKDRTDSVAVCKWASAGHPNVKGAEKYAEAIYPFLP